MKENINMIRVFSILLVIAGLLPFSLEEAQSQAAPAQGVPATGNVSKGKLLFNETYACGSCHGIYGVAGNPRLVPQARSQAEFITYVRKPRSMPSFADASEQNLADVYAYIKSIPAPNPPAAKDIPILADIINRTK
jgi:mono/diheme cytochrome c family protein